jgi:uncharacterized membrane protein (UPF0127 family)
VSYRKVSGQKSEVKAQKQVCALFCFLLSVLCSLPACADGPKACLKDACYSVELARTPQAREQGLMGRDGLEPGSGMLFIFDAPGRYSFWMKNMKFPIDILWLDSDRKLVHIAESVPPCQSEPCPVYTPLSDARYVLEIPAGEAVLKKAVLSEEIVLEGIGP